MPFFRCPLLAAAVFFVLIAASAAAGLGDVDRLTVDGRVVDVNTTDGVRLRLSVLDEDLFRIEAGPAGVQVDEGSGSAPIVLEQQPSDVAAEVHEDGAITSLTTRVFELRIHHSPLRLELYRRSDGEVIWRELKPLSMGEKGTTQTLSSTVDERFFGGGQQNGAFQFKGRLMEISYSGGWEEGDRPSPAPFYMSTAGYGMLRNTWSEGEYDFRSDTYLSASHAENRFDAYVMVGESIHEVLDLYTRLTGRAGLLPRWAMGYGDADCYNDGDNVKKPGTVPEGWSDGPTGTTLDVVESVAARYREHDMPGAWILPNDGYGCGYEELPEVVEHLGELGFRTGLWTEDGVEQIAWQVGSAGTRVQKLDVAWTGKGSQWAMDANHDAAQGFLDNSDARPFIWTVMGWAGIQRYAVTWTGDQSGSWDYIRWHVPTLIGSGLSAMNYSTGDVDGIFGGSPETFTRDLQWKCFTPVLMGMSGWSKAERKHPWWFDEPYRSVNRRYLKLRMRLMPYIYNLARLTETTGAPMVRGLMWDHPEDPHAFTDDFPYQFFLGRDLLIAPVYQSQAANGGWRPDVYLPAGRWFDYWDGRVIAAGFEGLTVDIPVDLATLPVLVRAGAIITMYPEALYDGQVPADPLTLDLYPYGHSETTLYEDDGSTRAYQRGEFSEQRIEVRATTDAAGLTEVVLHPAQGHFVGKLEERSFELAVHGRARPREVRLDQKPLPEVADRASLSAAGSGWTWDPQHRGGTTFVAGGRLSTRQRHSFELIPAPGAEPAAPSAYPERPPADPAVPADALTVIGRPVEEPGHPLENAFDGDADTWFRTRRDQSLATGPHELVLALGGRREIEGLGLSPRNDKHWKYGQIRDYEIYMADVNGNWGEAVISGRFEQVQEAQEVRFAARAGRLLRLRILSTHDDGVDPMVLGATSSTEQAYDALAPVKVSPVTISELRLLEHRPPAQPPLVVDLVPEPEPDADPVMVDGLSFSPGLEARSESRYDFSLRGDLTELRADAGLLDSSEGALRFQVWGNERLLWDSGRVASGRIVKPRLDLRGITTLSLRTEALEGQALGQWITLTIIGFAGDEVVALAAP